MTLLKPGSEYWATTDTRHDAERRVARVEAHRQEIGRPVRAVITERIADCAIGRITMFDINLYPVTT
jgi:hypothetical protein